MSAFKPSADDGAMTLAMDRMAQSLRDSASTQEPDWDAMEARLMAQVEVQEVQERKATRYRSMGAGFLALAASFALWMGHTQAPQATSEQPLAAAVEPVRSRVVDASTLAEVRWTDEVWRDASSLKSGDILEPTGELALATIGQVRWRLSPGARAVIVRASNEVRPTVRLERGSLHAKVVPVAPGSGIDESFAVEVAQTRVAVHGTEFTVDVRDASLLVTVDEGVVGVGPVGSNGRTERALLTAPTQAEVSADGASTVTRLPYGEAVAPTPADVRGARGLKPISRDKEERGDVTAPAVMPEVAVRPLSTQTLRSAVEGCFASAYSVRSDVNLQVSTVLDLRLNPDGSVVGARFSPPLKPEFQACVGAALERGFTPGTPSQTLPFSLGK